MLAILFPGTEQFYLGWHGWGAVLMTLNLGTLGLVLPVSGLFSVFAAYLHRRDADGNELKPFGRPILCHLLFFFTVCLYLLITTLIVFWILYIYKELKELL